MRLSRTLLPLLCLAPLCMAQLTKEQKVADFNQLVGLYATNYGPYELKRDVFGFDLFNVKPWIDQVNQSKSDNEFYDILTKYVASLRDSHDEFFLPSSFDAWLHMDGDIYDGKFIIDFIDRSYLSARTYPFTIGDELISVDGKPVADLIQAFSPYAVNGSSNAISRQRISAGAITERYERWNARAGDISDMATIVVQQKTGGTKTYTITWDVFGVRLGDVGVTPTPQSVNGVEAESARGITRRPRQAFAPLRWRGSETAEDGSVRNPWGVWTPGSTQEAVDSSTDLQPDQVPEYMAPLQQLRNFSYAAAADNFGQFSGISPFGSPAPVFDPPSSFALRLGAKSADQFLSGTFKAGAYTLGFIRIPSFAPASTTVALQQFAAEMAYFQQNTDGLVIDEMANGGGSGCYAQSLASYLMPSTFRGLGQELRATQNWRLAFSSSLTLAKAQHAPQYVIDLYAAYLADIDLALKQNRGRTGSLPLCGASFDADPPTDRTGKLLSYSKPIIVLTDNFTLSSAEIFAMFLQDNKRATIFGMRTDGGGGNVVGFSSATNYSQGSARVTEGVITRLQPVATPGYAASIYYDGVGIYPDIVQDYMTTDNLQNGGATFVDAFTTAISNLIQKGK